MTAARLAQIGSVGAVLAWAAKAVAIGIAGGLDQSPAESPLFLLGLVLALVGAAALGAAVTAGRSTLVRAVAAVAVVVPLLLVTVLAGAISGALQPDTDPHWVWGEINLWVSALVLLAAVAVLTGRSSRGGAAPRASV